MSFGAPQFFWALLALPLLAGLYLRNESLRSKLLRRLVAARLLPELTAGASPARRGLRFGLAMLGLLCVIVALAQPRWGYTIEENQRHGLDVMIAIDTSKSMLSTDATPNRLTRAKFAAQDLLDSLPAGRIGLIAFAGNAFVQAPLTIDYSAVQASIEDLDTNTIPRGGTDIAAAIRTAAEAFGRGESAEHALVIFTDGEELEESAVQAARDVKGAVRIFTVGVGTREGSLIPVPDENGGTSFVKDETGAFVKSHLDEERLKQIAEATGGFYLHLEGGPQTVKALVQDGLGKMTGHEFKARETRPIERYEWPLAAGLLLLAASALIGERRRIAARVPRRAAVAVAALPALLAMICTPRASAKNAGVDQYDHRDYKDAYNTFQQQLQRNPASDGLEFDKGTAAYKNGDYDQALEAFGKVIGSQDAGLRGQAEYNLGNTLVQRGALQQDKDQKIKQWTDALQHYDQALKIDPNFADAKYNRDLVQKMIEDLKKNPPPQQQQQNQQQQQQQNQKNQQQQNQQQNQSQQPRNNQQNGQNQQSQNQQNQQQGQSQQQQQQQAQNQQGQNQQQQQQNGGQGQQQTAQQQPAPSQNGQPSGSPSPSENAQNQNSTGNEQRQQGEQQQANNSGAAPKPAPAQQQDVSGNIQAAPSPASQQQQQQEQAAARAASTDQNKTGEMTPSQARALIDSLRDEDEHLLLTGTGGPPQEPVTKDW